MPSLPPVTKALMLICTVVFCLDQLLGAYFPLGPWFALWPVQSGEFMPWQLVSYAFLHGSFAHLLLNMLGLWMFGADVERLWGQQRYLNLLLASVLTAAVAQLTVTWLLGSGSPTVGASGALYGLLLAYALLFPKRQFDLVGFLPMVLVMIPGQIFYTLGIVLYVVLLTNRQAVPIRPVLIPSLAMVAIFGALELFQGVFNTRSGIAPLRAPGRHAGCLADDPLLARTSALPVAPQALSAGSGAPFGGPPLAAPIPLLRAKTRHRFMLAWPGSVQPGRECRHAVLASPPRCIVASMDPSARLGRAGGRAWQAPRRPRRSRSTTRPPDTSAAPATRVVGLRSIAVDKASSADSLGAPAPGIGRGHPRRRLGADHRLPDPGGRAGQPAH